jgi:hypothetical protein
MNPAVNNAEVGVVAETAAKAVAHEKVVATVAPAKVAANVAMHAVSPVL